MLTVSSTTPLCTQHGLSRLYLHPSEQNHSKVQVGPNALVFWEPKFPVEAWNHPGPSNFQVPACNICRVRSARSKQHNTRVHPECGMSGLHLQPAQQQHSKHQVRPACIGALGTPVPHGGLVSPETFQPLGSIVRHGHC